MIINEFKKNLVILKGVGCDYIDEAFIILKGNLPHEIKVDEKGGKLGD